MSLRTKVAVAMALLAAAATAVVAMLAIRVTAQQQVQQVDLLLARAADSPGMGHVLGPMGPERGPLPRGPLSSTISVLVLDGDRRDLVWGDADVIVPADVVDEVDRGEMPQFSTTTTAGEGDYRAVARAISGGRVLVLSESLTPQQEVINGLLRNLVLLGVVVAVIAGLLGWYAAAALIRPLRRLTTAAESVTGTGNLQVSVRTDSGDEIGRLSRAFDEMLESLSLSQQAQRQLVQDAGHELRTPITSILSNAEVLRRHPDLQADLRNRIAADLTSEARELARLIASLADLAALVDDREAPEGCSAAELVAEAVRRLPASAAARVRVEGDAILRVRPQQVRRALVNLVTNADKFAPGDAAIEVRVRSNARAEVTVRDHGPGLDEDDLPKAFDRFWRAASARSVPGSGLGLSIVADICRHNGGSVSLANHADGGAVATLILPVAPLSEDRPRS